MNRPDDNSLAVKIANPKTLEFQVVRTSLLPGLLKTVRENRSHALPIRIFETSDIVVKDRSEETQARNIRHAAALWCNRTAGFEVVHGLLDRVMLILEIPRISVDDKKATHGYYIKETDGMFPRNKFYATRLITTTVRSNILPRSSRGHILPLAISAWRQAIKVIRYRQRCQVCFKPDE